MTLSSKWTIMFEYTITRTKKIQLEALETIKEYE
jgi:hypothetical protein